MPQPSTPERLLALPAVIEATSLSRSTIYDMIAKGRFPAPVAIGENRVAWPASRVTAWIDAKISGVQ